MSPGSMNIAVLHAQQEHRFALCDFIADEVGFRIVGDVPGGNEALDLLRVTAAHVLVVDLESVGAEAPHLISAARALSPATSILLLVRGQPNGELEELMDRGAGGYVAMDRARVDLVAALRTIGMGRRYRPPVDKAPAE
jgi:DNA-binding NarL/FixJ family response regulator